MTTSRVRLHTSSEHGVLAASTHFSSGTSFANSSRQSKNSCLFTPFVTHLMSSVLSILILGSAYGLHLKGTSISMATGMRLEKYTRAYKIETKVTAVRSLVHGHMSGGSVSVRIVPTLLQEEEGEEERTVRSIFCVVKFF